GIRDFHVTGVQTCALPISASSWLRWAHVSDVHPSCSERTTKSPVSRISPKTFSPHPSTPGRFSRSMARATSLTNASGNCMVAYLLFSLFRHSSPLPQERPPHTAWRWRLSWGMGALATVVEFTSELQERPGRFNVRGVRRPGHTPVGILQDRGRRLTVAAQVADDPHGGPAGGEEDLVLLRRPGVLSGPPPPAPDQDLQGQLVDLRPNLVLRGLVPRFLCGAETLYKLDDGLQVCHGLRARPLCHHHASVLLLWVIAPLFAGLAGRPPRATWRRRLSRGLVEEDHSSTMIPALRAASR